MKLEVPVQRYITGRRPTHSSTKKLHENFYQLPKEVMAMALQSSGYLNDEEKPTKKAIVDDIADICGKSVIWNLEKIEELLTSAGLKPQRQSVNQELTPPKPGEDLKFVNLGTIASYFNVSANQIGKWLDELDLREEETKMGNKRAIDEGFCRFSEMRTGQGKKTRQITMWNLYLVQCALLEAGHELDFDYDKTLAAKGKNSAVEVTTIDERAREFTKEFVELFNDPQRRKETEKLVKKTPKAILVRAENILKRPGFLTSGKFREKL